MFNPRKSEQKSASAAQNLISINFQDGVLVFSGNAFRKFIPMAIEYGDSPTLVFNMSGGPGIASSQIAICDSVGKKNIPLTAELALSIITKFKDKELLNDVEAQAAIRAINKNKSLQPS